MRTPHQPASSPEVWAERKMAEEMAAAVLALERASAYATQGDINFGYVLSGYAEAIAQGLTNIDAADRQLAINDAYEAIANYKALISLS